MHHVTAVHMPGGAIPMDVPSNHVDCVSNGVIYIIQNFDKQ